MYTEISKAFGNKNKLPFPLSVSSTPSPDLSPGSFDDPPSSKGLTRKIGFNPFIFGLPCDLGTFPESPSSSDPGPDTPAVTSGSTLGIATREAVRTEGRSGGMSRRTAGSTVDAGSEAATVRTLAMATRSAGAEASEVGMDGVDAGGAGGDGVCGGGGSWAKASGW